LNGTGIRRMMRSLLVCMRSSNPDTRTLDLHRSNPGTC
jgi:hypothetical protein